MKNSIIKIEGLYHRYSKDWAVKDVSFEINKNGILGLLGSNGAGKSTVMNILCGVINQTKGDVYIDGINIRKHPIEAKELIGFLPQKAPLHFDLTVDEYLIHCAYMRTIEPSKIEEAVEIAKEKCGISHFSSRVLRNLSGGYQQRVGIAQAIIHNPKLVVLDEPTNGLDPNQINEVRKLIQEIAQDRSILLSTHILSEVQATCDDIIMIENGQIVFSDTMSAFNNYIKPNTIQLNMDTPPTEDEFKKIPGIEYVEFITKNEIRLQFNKDEEVSKKIIELSVLKNWNLKEVYLEKSSLELIFAQLSNRKS